MQTDTSKTKKNLKKVYTYKNLYVDDPFKLYERIKNKTIIPHQVEVQPGPKSRKLCWLDCPYCYGGSSKMTDEHLSDERYPKILKQVVDGGVNKFIFAGYATDPLNYKFIDNLTVVPFEHNKTIGFHTKAIKVNKNLLDQLTNKNLAQGSYFSVSVDAGTVETYNIVHGLNANMSVFYNKVLENFGKINEGRKSNSNCLDLSATYLLNDHNSTKDEVLKFINDFRNAGADILRFTFPQAPRGYSIDKKNETVIPDRFKKDVMMKNLKEIIEKENSEKCKVIILDYDKEMDIDNKSRTLPCFARWIFPSIGFDGYLGHCSEAAAPHFRSFALGNLNERDFWDIYYDYDSDNLPMTIKKAGVLMNKHDCRCDRKEHTVNKIMQNISKLY